jgi:hypothetical protein
MGRWTNWLVGWLIWVDLMVILVRFVGRRFHVFLWLGFVGYGIRLSTVQNRKHRTVPKRSIL